MSETLEGRIREIIGVELQVPAGDVVPGLSLRRDLGMDSVAALNIVFAVEDVLGIRVPEDEITDADDLEAILRLVERHSPPS